MADILASEIKALAKKLGFDLVGITTADPLDGDARRLSEWLRAGFAGEMGYMARNPDRRARPREILPEAKSVICLGMYYYPGDPSEPDGNSYGAVSRYAWGKDYHTVIEQRLNLLTDHLKERTGPSFRFKPMVDHGAVLEKAVAQRAGLGFFGKNTLLIHPGLGSWFFLAELVTNLALEPDRPQLLNQCGSCNACLSACPTGALLEPFVLDARRCISYLTIELKTAIPESLRPRLEDHIFGCDICQEVCPFNAGPRPTAHKEFSSPEGAGPWLSLPETLAIQEDQDFKARFAGTPLLRPKRQGLQRNAALVAGNLESESNKNG